VENSSEGVVTHTLDSFLDSPLKICGEIALRIRHNLLALATSVDSITTVMAHSQSLAQCRKWLSEHLPGRELQSVNSNAEAAERAAADARVAAIASRDAGELYRLGILASNIEDDPGNTTRFLVIGNRVPGASGDDKTSLLVSSANKPGALYRLLEPLARNQVSMTRIESRPSRKGLWQYVFFIDIEGHCEEPKIREVLAELEKEATLVKLLGSYPRAVL